MQLAFLQCVNLDAGTYQDDQSHMSYSENGYYGAACPDSHPTDISSIMYRIFFRPDEYGGSLTNLHLSSDVKMDRILPGGTTAHADWFGTWHPGAMDMWVENCNNTQADCETGLLNRNPAISLVPRKRDFYEARIPESSASTIRAPRTPTQRSVACTSCPQDTGVKAGSTSVNAVSLPRTSNNRQPRDLSACIARTGYWYGEQWVTFGKRARLA